MKYEQGTLDHLIVVLDLMASDNGLQMRPHEAIEWPPETEAIEKELAAAELSDDEEETLAMGEDSERKALVKEKGLQKTQKFLHEAFDGKYQHVIYLEV